MLLQPSRLQGPALLPREPLLGDRGEGQIDILRAQ